MQVPLFSGMPEIASGYELNPAKGFFSVVLPAGRTNKVKNPSLGINTTGYIAVGGSISRTTEWQAKGTFSLKVTPGAGVNDGVYYGDSNVLSLTSGEMNWFSFYFKGVAGLKYKAYFASTAGSQVGPAVQFTASGIEQRVIVNYLETSTTNRRLYVVKDNSTNVQPFYIDALQVEVGSYPTTYLDGSLKGLVSTLTDYYWTGQAHASESVRISQSADGGRIVNLLDLGFRLIAILGLGLGGITNIATPLSTGGSLYQRTNYQDRTFSLVGSISGNSYEELSTVRQALIDSLNVNRTSPQQPIKLLYTPADCSANDIGRTVEIPCVLDGGLAGNIDNLFQERLSLDFHTYPPFAASNTVDYGTSLAYQNAFTASYFAWRDENGNWYGENLSDWVQEVIPLPDGTWAVAGNFLNAGGDANADLLAKFNPSTRTFSSFNSTPLTSLAGTAQVSALLLLPDNNRVLFGGNFDNAGGDASADKIGILNLTTGAYSMAASGGLGAIVEPHCLVLLPDGTVAVGGDFSDAGGVAAADRLARWSPFTGVFSAFGATSLYTGVGGVVLGIVVDKQGNLVISSSLADLAGIAAADYIVKLNLTSLTYSAISSTILNSTCYWVSIGNDGDYFLAGIFTDVGGDSNADRAVSFNGSGFSALGTGIQNGTAYWNFLRGNGDILYSGDFTQAGGLLFSDKIAIWTGSAWVPFEVDFPGSAIVFVYKEMQGKIAVGFSTAGTATTAVSTTINNIGTAPSYSSFKFKGPGTLVSLKNLTNGNTIYFNLTLASGEEAVLDFSAGGTTFTSNIRGNILGSIAPGSNSNFRIEPGSNIISTFIIYTATEQNDGGNELSAFSLQGVTSLNSNEGELYVNIVNLGGSNRRVDFYRDSSRTLLVAQTGTYSTTGSKAITQANSSGITGTLNVDAVGAADSDIIINVPVASMKWTPMFNSIDGAMLPRILP